MAPKRTMTIAEAGRLGGKARARAMTGQQRSDAARTAARAAAASLSPEEKSARGRKMIAARWAKQKKR